MDISFEKVVIYSLGVGILCSLIGAITNIRILALIGALGFLPLSIFLFIALLGFVMETLGNIIPDFKRKDLIIGVIAFTVAIVFLLIIIFGGSGDSFPCQTYRGFPTC